MTKYTAIKTTTKDCYHLTEFGKSDMNDRITGNTEEYLVHCLYKGVSNHENFNGLCCTMYHQKTFQLDLEELPCTASTICFYILGPYLHCFHWLHTPFQSKILLNPIDFGYDFSEELLIAIMVSPIISYQETILHHAIFSSVPMKMFASADRCQYHAANFVNVKGEINVKILMVLKMNIGKVKQYVTKSIVCILFFLHICVFILIKILPRIKSIK